MIIEAWYVTLVAPFHFLEITFGYKLELDVPEKGNSVNIYEKNHTGVIVMIT